MLISLARSWSNRGRRGVRAGLTMFGALLALSILGSTAHARVRLDDICTIYGQREIKLTGIGLVVGLNGTGDGGDNLPAMRALASAMKLMNSPVLDAKELRKANNVAIVWIEATIPQHGARRGQLIDCYVSSFMGAKSLRGGRLLAAPLETVQIGDSTVKGVASGAIEIEDAEVPTSGKITSGVQLRDDFVRDFIDVKRGHVLTLLLNGPHSSFRTASEVARVVNSEFSFEAGNRQLATAVGPGVVEVRVPEQYHDSPVEFVAQVLEVGIDNPVAQAKVVVNNKTGVVIVTGEVEISPVVITHKNLVVEVGDAGAPPPPAPFVSVDQQERQGSQQLKQLVDALNQLKVEPKDVISIIRELHRSGRLHAAYEEH